MIACCNGYLNPARRAWRWYSVVRFSVKMKITIAEFEKLTDKALPFAQLLGLKLEAIEPTHVDMRASFTNDHLRPGGTVSGPVMMGLADAAVYALILSHIGPVELAVTTNLNINFLRKPEPADLLARAAMLKLGKRLAVAEVSIYSGSFNSAKVAHAVATYSIPPLNGVNKTADSATA